MAINSVSSSTAHAPALRTQAKEVKLPEPAKKAERPAPAKQEAKPEVKQRAEAPKPQPVVNTQGQTTGRVISTSA